MLSQLNHMTYTNHFLGAIAVVDLDFGSESALNLSTYFPTSSPTSPPPRVPTFIICHSPDRIIEYLDNQQRLFPRNPLSHHPISLF